MRVLALFSVVSLAVFGATVTFEGATGPVASYTESGITFTAVGGGGQLIFQTSPNGTRGILDDNSPRKLIRADIPGGTNFVSVDLGDFDSDSDTLNLWVYDALNNQLAHVAMTIDASFTGMKTLTASSPDIAYAIFGATDAVNGNSVFGDNFTTGGSVPEPGTFVLLGAAVVFFAIRRLR